MQRIHDEDFTGFLLNTDPTFKHIKIPAIATEDEKWVIEDSITKQKHIFRRAKGEALHPQRESLAKLEKSREYMGEFNFSGQYQQDPAPAEGAIIKKNWLQYYDTEELKKQLNDGTIQLDYVIQSWDTANKVEKHNDYSACVTLLADNKNRVYVWDCYREKLDFPDLIKKVKDKYQQASAEFPCPVEVFIEDMGSGTQLIQTLNKEYQVYPESVKPEYDKATRLKAVSHLIENGSCLFPDNQPHWWQDFFNELIRFPKCRHDDQCDALSQALGNKRDCSQNFSYVATGKTTDWSCLFGG
ncbi:MAG: phage terminase large subunit [Vulcanimicrobiota bacterium]